NERSIHSGAVRVYGLWQTAGYTERTPTSGSLARARCQRQSDFASVGRSKTASTVQARRPPIGGLLASRFIPDAERQIGLTAFDALNGRDDSCRRSFPGYGRDG